MNKLVELRSQLEGKQAELSAILAKDDPPEEEVKKGEQLWADMEEIGKEIDRYNEERKKLADLKSKSDDMKSRMKEIVRPIPFPTKEDKGVEFDSIEAGVAELEKKALTGTFKSGGHFTYAIYKAGPHRRGDQAAVESLNNWDSLVRE
jgi:seryl-tRNA synthetase